MVQNKSLIFKDYPNGWPVKGKDLVIEDLPIDLEQNAPQDGLITKNLYFSYDPYLRGRMRKPEVKSYSAPFPLGEPIKNAAISKVVKSGTSKFSEGDILCVYRCPFQEYSILDKDVVDGSRKIDNPHNIDLKAFLGPLGMPGLTAYSSFYEIGKPQKGETIFVSAASGAVGQLVGQLAKHEGMKVIGSVGDDKKLDFITKELGFHGGFNYKKEKVDEALSRLAPNGIDIYYDNVGGEQLEVAITHMNDFGRIVACGSISQYNNTPGEQYGIKTTGMIVGKRLKMQGFIVSDKNMGPVYTEEHQKNVQKWIADGSFKLLIHETNGMDNAVDGFLGLYKGENFGKAILVVADS